METRSQTMFDGNILFGFLRLASLTSFETRKPPHIHKSVKKRTTKESFCSEESSLATKTAVRGHAIECKKELCLSHLYEGIYGVFYRVVRRRTEASGGNVRHGDK